MDNPDPKDRTLGLPLELGEAFDSGLKNHLEAVALTLDWPQTQQDIFKNLTKSVLKAVRAYSLGWPDRAYQALLDSFGLFGSVPSYEASGPLFRMRVVSNQGLTAEDMFHIPFEKRRLVSSQRFSIPGLPCLYTARSLYVCWEELRRPPLHTVQVSALRPIRPIHVLQLSRDLSDPHFRVLYPLAAACSVRAYADTPFRPEYIVPQLLLQWLTQESTFEGIECVSTHVSSRNEPHLSNNVIFPVADVRRSGYCEKLTALFEITEPLSWEFVVNSGLGGERHRPKGAFHLAESRLDYEPTVFAYVESVLAQQTARTVNP